jgi:hypothetical protein
MKKYCFCLGDNHDVYYLHLGLTFSLFIIECVGAENTAVN